MKYIIFFLLLVISCDVQAKRLFIRKSNFIETRASKNIYISSDNPDSFSHAFGFSSSYNVRTKDGNFNFVRIDYNIYSNDDALSSESDNSVFAILLGSKMMTSNFNKLHFFIEYGLGGNFGDVYLIDEDKKTEFHLTLFAGVGLGIPISKRFQISTNLNLRLLNSNKIHSYSPISAGVRYLL